MFKCAHIQPKQYWCILREMTGKITFDDLLISYVTVQKATKYILFAAISH